MIDETTVRGLRDDFRVEVMRALSTLSATGVILAQIELEKARLLTGSAEEPETDLAAKIKMHRLHVAYLEELHTLGLKLAEEL